MHRRPAHSAVVPAPFDARTPAKHSDARSTSPVPGWHGDGAATRRAHGGGGSVLGRPRNGTPATRRHASSGIGGGGSDAVGLGGALTSVEALKRQRSLLLQMKQFQSKTSQEWKHLMGVKDLWKLENKFLEERQIELRLLVKVRDGFCCRWYLVLTCWRLQEQAKQLDKETRTVANLRERLKRVRRGGCGCRQQRRGGRLCANAQCMTWCSCRLLPGQPAAPHERQHSDGILHYHRLVSFALEHVEIAEPRLHVPVHLWLGALHIHHLRVPRAVLRDRYRCTQLAVPNTIGGALPPLSLVASVAVCSPECVFHCHSGH